MREHPWPDALEDVVAGSWDHLDAAAEPLLPPGGLPPAFTDAHDRRRRAVPLGRELDVAFGGLGWIGIGCRLCLGETEEDANYERGLVFSGS